VESIQLTDRITWLPCAFKNSGGEGGINIHRLNFANNTGKFLLLLSTPPVTCDRAHLHFTSIVGKTNMACFGSNGSHFRS